MMFFRGQRFHWVCVLRTKFMRLRNEWCSPNSLFTRNWCLLPRSTLPFFFPLLAHARSQRANPEFGENTHHGARLVHGRSFFGDRGAHTLRWAHPPHFLHRKNLGPRIDLAAPSLHAWIPKIPRGEANGRRFRLRGTRRPRPAYPIRSPTLATPHMPYFARVVV